MEKLEDWPCEWKEILLCTKYWECNGECEVSYEPSPLMVFLKLAQNGWVVVSISVSTILARQIFPNQSPSTALQTMRLSAV